MMSVHGNGHTRVLGMGACIRNTYCLNDMNINTRKDIGSVIKDIGGVPKLGCVECFSFPIPLLLPFPSPV